MTKLTSKEYWDYFYQAHSPSSTAKPPPCRKGQCAALLTLFYNYTRSYSEYLLWDCLLPRFCVIDPTLKIFEIGCAPGTQLIRFNKTFAYQPYGIDYSLEGLAATKKLFNTHHIDQGSLIHGDFLTADLGENYAAYFDIVTSRGFIEHFDDPHPVIEKHFSLLKTGGKLIIVIPNKKGINYLLHWCFNRKTLPFHNLKIMDKTQFKALFTGFSLTPLYCDYYGTFNLAAINTSNNAFLRVTLKFCYRIQQGLNILLRLTFGKKGFECRFWSPYLIYIGIKK